MACAAALIATFGFLAYPTHLQAQNASKPAAVGSTTVVGADGIGASVADPSRIVTLGGAITETVYALGFGANVMGADESSLHPAEIFRKPRLSVFRQSTPEGILSLNPTLVISTMGIRPLTVPQQLREAGVPVLLLEDAYSPEQAADRFRTIGGALGRSEQAEGLISAMNRDLAKAAELQKGLTKTPKILFIYTRGASMVNVAGTGTGADAIIALAGGVNVINQYEGYRPLTAEAAVLSAPDIILVPQHGLELLGGIDALLKQPGLALTPAGKNRAVLAVDDSLLLSFGPRLGSGVLSLTQEILRVMND
jgi:iron complex transport system substrate-binding protein